MTWNLYILLCDQKNFYIGITDNLERRLLQHKSKQSPYTKKFSEIKLVYKEEYSSIVLVKKRELQIKKWSIAKKKALIEKDVAQLKKLSKSSDTGEGSKGR
jgi:predicted GIY-YIG superfamily endonuclease